MFSYYNRLALTVLGSELGVVAIFWRQRSNGKGGGDFQTICTVMFPQRSTNKMFTQSDNPISFLLPLTRWRHKYWCAQLGLILSIGQKAELLKYTFLHSVISKKVNKYL